MNELEIVEWVRKRSRTHSAFLCGIGDDMAVLRPPNSTILLSSDLLLDGVHFDSSEHSFLRIGCKAVARSLSDCAAMAVHPVAVLVSVALPHPMVDSSIRDLLDGMHTMAGQFDVGVAGGDTARWNGPLVCDVCVLGEPYPGIEPVLRSGARMDDRLYVTGSLGGSIRGKHLDFLPRIHEARRIAEALGGSLHAMMDLSDGLSLDLWRMVTASGVGAALEERLLESVISEDARRCASQDGKSPLEHALCDGEDYELLLAVAPEADVSGLDLHPIGTITRDGFLLLRRDGTIETLQPRGWVH